MAAQSVKGLAPTKFTPVMAPVAPHDPAFEATVCQALDETFGDIAGHDSHGARYESIAHLWEVEKARPLTANPTATGGGGGGGGGEGEGKEKSTTGHTNSSVPDPDPNPDGQPPSWYGNALNYWDNCPPTLDGVLGGFGSLTTVDVQGRSGPVAMDRQLALFECSGVNHSMPGARSMQDPRPS